MDVKMIIDKVYHCALDDTIDLLEKLSMNKNDIESIFELEELSLLRKFNKLYGTKFSLYLFYEKDPCRYHGFNLSKMTGKFKEQWQDNSGWLKMSFHARTKRLPDFPYINTKYEIAKKDCEDVKKEIVRFAGIETWENITRTHYWGGSKEAVRAWHDCGIWGLFYHSGVSSWLPDYRALHFSKTQLKELSKKDFWYDKDTDMLYITTNLMLPGWTVKQVKQRLEKLDKQRIVEAWVDDFNLIELKTHLEETIKWCTVHNYKPAFYEEVFKKIAI